MKKVITIAITVAIIASLAAAPAAAGSKSNKAIAKAYAEKHYKGYKVKFIKSSKLDFETLTTRAGSKIVYIEIIKSKSRGKYGETAQGWIIGYNKKVKKGKKVTSYLIYNPNSNAEDDVVAVVDNKRIR